MTQRSVHVTVGGRVQGVGFRWFAREQARALRLDGWVKNQADGRVELIVRGPAADVETYLAALRRGPPRAVVEELQERDVLQHEQFTTPFDIR